MTPDGPSDPEATGGTGGSGDPPTDGEIEVLHQTVEELRQENEALRAGEAAPARSHRRVKAVFSWVLVVLACLLAVVSVVVVFGRNQLLNTDTYVSTVAPLASNPAIQTQVATKVSSELIARTDLEARVKNALPSRAGFLASPITSEVKSATYSVALKLVQSEQFYTLWVAANRASHKQLVAVLTGSSSGSVSTKGGKVTVDLSQVEVAVKQKLDSRGITVFNKIPAVKGLNLVLFQSDQLVKIQRLVRILNKLVVVLPIASLLLFAGGVVLARNRRRGLVRAAAGLALSMGVVLVAVSVARNQYLSSLSPDQSKPANAAVIDTVSAPLQDTVRTMALIAAVVAVIAVLAGVPAVRRWVSGRRRPEWLTHGPFHDFVSLHRRGLQWAVLGVGLFVLIVWNKLTTLVAVVVVLVTLAVVGIVGLLAGRHSVPSPVAAGGRDVTPGE